MNVISGVYLRGVLKQSVLLSMLVLFCPWSSAETDASILSKSTPIPVVFGVRALAPETPINPEVAFVSQLLTLPEVVCNSCTEKDKWSRRWSVSQMTLNRDNTRKAQGWYVFNSGLKGIGISVYVDPKLTSDQPGSGMQLNETGDIAVGLVRLGQDTGGGLAVLPPSDFTRVTTFRDPDGAVRFIQEDTIRVSADIRVPTCTSTAGSLSFQLPEISTAWFRQNVRAGDYSDTLGSPVQLVVANCSENTHNVRIQFIPSGSVAASSLGLSTILVGRGEDGQEAGVGFLMKYQANGFGRSQQGTVSWDRNAPLIMDNPRAEENRDELTKGITVELQAFYARPKNIKPITVGRIEAKGMYQVSYE